MRAIVLMLCLIATAATQGLMPLNDNCARQAAQVWPFVEWRPFPPQRPLVLEELEARSALELCRAMVAAPHLAPADWRERVFGDV